MLSSRLVGGEEGGRCKMMFSGLLSFDSIRLNCQLTVPCAYT